MPLHAPSTSTSPPPPPGRIVGGEVAIAGRRSKAGDWTKISRCPGPGVMGAHVVHVVHAVMVTVIFGAGEG
jgi:hypothetical protein